MNYARNLPLDKNNMPFPAPPAFTSSQSQSGAPATSSVITFSANTTVLDVTVFSNASGNSAIIGKWGSASVTSTNFDWVVQSGQYRAFVVPVSVFGAPLASVAGANAANGLYNTVAVKAFSTVVPSILTTEY